MPSPYTKEQFWKLYEKLPQELKDALFAEETSNNIEDVCQRYEIEENLDNVVDLVGQVLVGVLAPEDFPETLGKELKLEKDIAKKAAQEINRFIFYPVRSDLEKLYQTGAVVSAKPAETTPSPTASIEQTKPEAPKAEDTYREPVE